MLFLDLDDFKLVNDSLGHTTGDALLVAVAGRLSQSLRTGDTAARFGGDEFAILLEETSGAKEACEAAERLIGALREPFYIEDHEIKVHASIGIAVSQGGRKDPTDLIQAADVAMYAAKAHGKGRYEVYEPDLQEAIVRRLDRTADLQRAMDGREFVVHYQPIVSLDGGHVVGLEALVRWRHPEFGLLFPDEFIDLAEETGLVVPLDRLVLKEACFQTHEWQFCQRGRPQSVGQRQYLRQALPTRGSGRGCLRGLCGGIGSRSSLFGARDHRRSLVQEAESVIERMLELKALGVSFAIDDFGTGYSSLSYLRRFPIDILKLDKSFVDNVAVSAEDGALAETIVQLGKNLHLQTLAEGIEHESQLEVLPRLGVQRAKASTSPRGSRRARSTTSCSAVPRSRRRWEAVWLANPTLIEEAVG